VLAIAARFGALHAARSRADHLRVKADATRASADTILAKWTRADRGLGAATLEAVERRLIEEEAALAGLAGSVGRDHARYEKLEGRVSALRGHLAKLRAARTVELSARVLDWSLEGKRLLSRLNALDDEKNELSRLSALAEPSLEVLASAWHARPTGSFTMWYGAALLLAVGLGVALAIASEYLDPHLLGPAAPRHWFDAAALVSFPSVSPDRGCGA